MKKEYIERLTEIVKPYYSKKGGHDWNHVLRVIKISERIAKKEKNVDLDVLRAAVLLHDVAREMEEKRKCKDHAKKGAQISPSMLKKAGFPKDKIERVVHCVISHRKSTGIKPEIIEAKILQDSDKMDIFGAIGIARTFVQHAKDKAIHTDKSKRLVSFSDYKTDSSLEMIRSLLLVRRTKFYTKEGRKILDNRLKFIKKFVNQFDKEWQGEI